MLFCLVNEPNSNKQMKKTLQNPKTKCDWDLNFNVNVKPFFNSKNSITVVISLTK